MDLYSLIAIVVITAGVVAGFIAWLFYDGGKKTIKKGGKLGQEALKEGCKILEPVSTGLGNLLNSIAGNIETKREDLAKLRVEIRNLTQKNERLKNRQISVEPIKQIFEVAWFQLPIQERNFVREVLQITPGSVTRNEELEYVGVYRANNIQKYGVDIDALRFRNGANSVIEIGGVGRTKLIGNIKPEVVAEFSELRKHLTGGPISDSRVIMDADPGKLKELRMHKQHAELLAAITEEKRVEEIERGVELLTMQYFKDYFAPRGYTVVKAEGEMTDGKSLSEIRDEINNGLKTLVSDTDKRLAVALAQTEAVEQEIHGEIQKIKAIEPRA